MIYHRVLGGCITGSRRRQADSTEVLDYGPSSCRGIPRLSSISSCDNGRHAGYRSVSRYMIKFYSVQTASCLAWPSVESVVSAWTYLIRIKTATSNNGAPTQKATTLVAFMFAPFSPSAHVE